jgi:hypothetical protein
MPVASAIAGAVDGDKGDTMLEPILMVGAVIDPKNAQAVTDEAGADALPELPVITDSDAPEQQ